jgi:hypothetical protein
MKMKIESKCGKYNVTIIKNGDYGFIAIANMNSFDSETMSNDSYWFTVGRYKAEKTAIRQAVKKMQDHNIALEI